MIFVDTSVWSLAFRRSNSAIPIKEVLQLLKQSKHVFYFLYPSKCTMQNLEPFCYSRA